MTSIDLAVAGAAQTARAVREATVSAAEACEAAIARIEAADGEINAVVVRDFDRARAAAKAIDASRKPDDPRPLLGVPMTVKESNDVAGLPSTWGMRGFAGNIAETDGLAVTRLKAAGAVILGKTNVSVSLADWQADNPIYGRTVNPHDHSRSPGGSSGGAAAALAAGMVPLELGSDIGGSIRIPAHFCGVYGHKPTYGIVPLAGHHFPGTDGLDTLLSVVGPLARSAEDLAIALDVVAGPAPGEGYRLALPAPATETIEGARVLLLDEHPVARLDSQVKSVLAGLCDRLDDAGAMVTRDPSRLPKLEEWHQVYLKIVLTVLGRGSGESRLGVYEWMELLDEQMRITRAWSELFEDFDVVLAPPLGVAAFPYQEAPDWADRTLTIDGEETRFGAQIAWPGMALLPGLPATAAPVGQTPDGLPVGVQIMANKYGDRTCLAFARALQEAGLAL